MIQLLFCLFLLPALLLPFDGQASRIEIHGHRGARALYPESTLAGFEYALELGVDVLEFDLHVTKDNKLVVSHDPFISPKTCLSSGSQPLAVPLTIRALPLAALQTLDCGSLKNSRFPKQRTVSGQTIPALDSVFTLIKNSPLPHAKKIRFNIELKSIPTRTDLYPPPEEMARLLIDALRKHGMVSRTIIQSFDHRTLAVAKRLEPAIQIAALTSDNLTDPVTLLRGLNAKILSPDMGWLTPQMVRDVHRIGGKVIPYTLNAPNEWEAALAMNVDGIITDDPEALMNYLKSRLDKPYAATESTVSINGKHVIQLQQSIGDDKKQPRIVSAEVIPGRGMHVFQLTAFFPEHGLIRLLTSPSIDEAAVKMNGDAQDFNGNQSFFMGGALLLPYANRLRGNFDPDERLVEVSILPLDKKVRVPANWKGQRQGAEVHSMHGLLLDKKIQNVELNVTQTSTSAVGTYQAGDFDGQWLSRSDVSVKTALEGRKFRLTVVATNTGKEVLPMGIGWHPFFNIFSNRRQQVRLKIPARKRTEMNNYDDVFPTGKLLPVMGTGYDFTSASGSTLGNLYLDDCFVDLKPNSRGITAEITDPAAHIGLRIHALSPTIRAFQIYAPTDQSFIALEPQFNVADPWLASWPKDFNSGMIMLKPGESTTYDVEVEPFIP